MIDTAKPYYYLTDMVFDRLQDHKALKRIGITLYGNKFFLKHPFGYTNPNVLFNLDRRMFWLETSLPKLLQGHNVFGNNQLQFSCLEVAKIIYHQLGLPFMPSECQQIEEHRIRLGRLDTTCSFIMPSQNIVSDTLSECWQQFRANGRKWSLDGSDEFETLYHQKHSTRVTDKLYNKYAELLVKSHAIKDCVPKREQIITLALLWLRFEVTWRYKELKRLGLEYADQWDMAIVKKMMGKRLDKLDFQGVIKDRLVVSDLDGLKLNKRDEAFYVLWQQGAKFRHSTGLFAFA